MMKPPARRVAAPVAALFALLGIARARACGGGSGAPNNPYEPPPPTTPAAACCRPAPTSTRGSPATLTISGGVAPYRAFSTNSGVLPVAANVPATRSCWSANAVDADITVVDHRAGRRAGASQRHRHRRAGAAARHADDDRSAIGRTAEGNLCSGQAARRR